MEGDRDFWTLVLVVTLGMGVVFVGARSTSSDTRRLTSPATLEEREDPAAAGWTSPSELQRMVNSAHQAPSALEPGTVPAAPRSRQP